MNIVLASRNKKKVEELRKIMETDVLPGTGLSVNILTPDNFPECEEVEEDGDTFEANALKKAVYTSKCTGMTAIADDSGLEVDALNGAPGVLSARYAGESADDIANLEKLLNEMKGVPPEKRSARFVCCIALASGDDVKTFFGSVEGSIGMAPKGKKGFGYDPVFYPEGYDRTFAEMSDDEKNALSHRGKALRKLQEYLSEKLNKGGQ
ncbi:MAG TPA: XTP/dITP diphosphatase [Nitrospirae bacterium]|nr:non-canonical purine NTP pyrophosphatase [bacterium BMS3Abin06]HDH13532.1 XTP/dITP diphosphatase [Nitrospirota bacterium]HDZ01028.1 XTP/dITP diphosphatase [Nitrospirota bacterium]